MLFMQSMRMYYMVEAINIQIFSQEKNWVITTKKGKGKLPLFCGNGERVIPIYAEEVAAQWQRRISLLQLLW